MTQEEFLKLIVAICKRPKMYTPTGTFYETVSFMEGLGAGAGIDGDIGHSKFTRFLRWMAKRLDNNDRFPILWTRFAEHFSTEQEAFEALPSLYEEFVSDSNQ
jgi:hypothetical protein